MSRLDDYLDDRLDGEERARFEERLAGDEELAGRLAAALEIRRELRGGDEVLPEAFYTRTVARFSARRRRLPLGLSWSTAGLAVATIAAAAIFVPYVLREEPPGMPRSPRALEESTGFTEKAAPEKSEIAAADDERTFAQQSKDDLAGRDAAEEKNVGNLVDRKRQDAANEPVSQPIQEPLASPKPKRVSPPPPAIAQQPGRRVQEAPETEIPVEMRESISKLETEAVPEEGQSLGKGRASEADPSVELNVEFDDGQLDKLEDSDAPADSEVSHYRVAMPAAVELAIDLAGAGEIEVLDSRDPALDVATGEKKENRAVSRLESKTAAVQANRFVAIGKRPGLDACNDLKIRRTDKAWEIVYDDSGSSTGTVSCGIEIPADGLEIRFQGWPVDE